MRSALVLAVALLLLPLAVATAAGNWEYDLEVANRLLENGYLDAAQEDFQKVITTYAGQTPALDRGWLGLGKVYDARGDLQRSKTCLEQVLERGADPLSCDAARQMYIRGKALADAELLEAERAVTYFETQYAYTSWLDVFNKLWIYFDLRKARKTQEEKTTFVKSFNPRYLIPPVVAPQPAVDPNAFQVSAQEMSEILNMVPEEKVTLPQTQPVAAEPVNVIVPTLTAVTTGAEVEVLKAKREAYLAAYRDLQTALASKNQVAIQQATSLFQASVAEYNQARSAVAATK